MAWNAMQEGEPLNMNLSGRRFTTAGFGGIMVRDKGEKGHGGV